MCSPASQSRRGSDFSRQHSQNRGPRPARRSANREIHPRQDQAIPGVSSAGIASVLPMDDGGWIDPVETRDHPSSCQEKALKMRVYKFVSPGLLDAMGNKLVVEP